MFQSAQSLHISMIQTLKMKILFFGVRQYSLCWDRDSGAWDSGLYFYLVKVLEVRNDRAPGMSLNPEEGKWENTDDHLKKCLSTKDRTCSVLLIQDLESGISSVGQYAQIN